MSDMGKRGPKPRPQVLRVLHGGEVAGGPLTEAVPSEREPVPPADCRTRPRSCGTGTATSRRFWSHQRAGR
jgi:hypothetical protein